MDNRIIYIKDFSITPGSRYKDEGKKAHSGEEFRESFLEPVFKEIMNTDNHLIINLDGTIGYGTSWLEEVFGGLTRTYGEKIVLEKLQFISEEEDYLIEDIIQYIKDAEKL